MNLLAPVKNIGELKCLISLGADEFYAGILTPSFRARYTNVFAPNLRQISRANFTSFRTLGRAVNIAHRAGKKIYIAYNATLSPAQHPIAIKEIRRIRDMGADAVMLGDLPFIMEVIHEVPGLRFHISCRGANFNSNTARFYKSLGAERAILPRHLTVDEIRGITNEVKEMGFEVFIISERCVFTNAFCFMEHGLYEADAGVRYRLVQALRFISPRCESILERDSLPSWLAEIRDDFVIENGPLCLRDYRIIKGGCREDFRFYNSLRQYRNSCGVCVLYALKGSPSLKGAKVIGRDHPKGKKERDVRFVRYMIDCIDKFSDDPLGYHLNARERFESTFGYSCTLNDCYYPDYCSRFFNTNLTTDYTDF